MSKVQVMDHPLIQHKISYIRSEEVGSKEFREIVGEIASLMCYEATRDLKLEDVRIKTPICEMVGKQLSGKKLAVVPILREFDDDQVDYIYSESFDTAGIGSAIMNRLLKAAGHHIEKLV